MGSMIVTTSINEKIHALAKEKNLKWSECLTKGILEMAYGNNPPPSPGEEILKETEKNQLAQLQAQNYQQAKGLKAMQTRIEELTGVTDGVALPKDG